MYKLLIVDDDEIEREGLTRNVRWAERNIQVVGTAADGEQGLEMAGKLCPDVVLTDIRMPRMDGLEMARCLRQKYPELKIVFLTAYEDFEYAKAAVRLQVIEYVLKYSSNLEVLEAVYRACNEYEKDRAGIFQKMKGEEKLRDDFIVGLLLGSVTDSEFQKKCALCRLNLTEMVFVPVVIHAGNSRAFAEKTPFNESLLLYAMKNICDEIFQQNSLSVILQGNIAILLDGKSPEELIGRAKPLLERYTQALQQNLQANVVAAVGDCVLDFHQIGDSYQGALQLLSIQDLLKEKTIVFAKDRKSTEKSQQAIYNQLRTYIDSHYYEQDLSLDSIAASAFVSSGYACTVFKKYMGVPAVTYIKNRRMEKAMELMRETNLLISHISSAVGYDNPRYFSMLFKKHTGVTPQQYQSNGCQSLDQ